MKLKQTKTNEAAITGLVDFPAVKRPEFTDSLKFPDNLTELTGANVSELIGRYSALLGFAIFKSSDYLMVKLRLEREIDSRETELFLETPALNHIERWKRDAVISSDSEICALHDKLTATMQLKERADSFVRIYEGYISALSRELTRKMSTQDGLRTSRGL